MSDRLRIVLHRRTATAERRLKRAIEALERRTFFAVGDTIATAMPVVVGHAAELEVSESIGDEASGVLDVDFFKVTLSAGDRLLADVDARSLDDGTELSALDGIIEVYDSFGFFVAGSDDNQDPDTGVFSTDPAVAFTAFEAGDYYIAVSGWPNYEYDPNTAESGVAGSTGDYRLQLVLNQIPLFDTFTAEAEAGVTTKIDVLSHVTDPDGDPIRLVDAFAPFSSGTASVNDNGTPADFSDDYVDYTGNLGLGFFDELYVVLSDGHERTTTFLIVSLRGAQLTNDPVDGSKTALFIAGGSDDDVITVSTKKGGKPQQRQLTVTINGENKGTFAQPTGSIYISSKEGHDRITIDSAVTASTYTHAGTGNDTATGGGGSDVIIGGESDFEGDADVLSGGNGRDLLIGGPDADRIDGGADDDILIAGFATNTFFYDTADLMREWTRTDQSYSNRILHLMIGGGFNRFARINEGSVFDDTAVDRLTGGGGLDFFASNGETGSLDVIVDLDKKKEFTFDVD